MSKAEAGREIIKRLNADACSWYASGNVEAVAQMFAEDCWQMPPHAKPLVGRAALRDFWKQAMQVGRWDFTLETQAVEVSGRIAVERGKYILRFSAGAAAPPGLKSSEDRGNYLVLWRHDSDGEWRAVWDAPVSELPLPQPA